MYVVLGVRKAATANGLACKMPRHRGLWCAGMRRSYAVGADARQAASAHDRCVWQLVGEWGIRRAWKVLDQQGSYRAHRLRQASLVMPLTKLS